MIVDTSVLLAYFNSREPSHKAVFTMIQETRAARVISPFVLAELDYFLLTRSGVGRESAVLRALQTPAWEIATITDTHLGAATELIERYADERIGLTDAMNIVLASAYDTRQIATLDRRHFSILRLMDGTCVEILP